MYTLFLCNKYLNHTEMFCVLLNALTAIAVLSIIKKKKEPQLFCAISDSVCICVCV